MKIAFIGCRDIHKLGGIESYMYHLCTELVRLGHEPLLYCESDHDGTETVNGFRVIHWKSPRSVYVCKIWLGLRSTLHTLRHYPDIRLFHYNAAAPSMSSWIARLFGRKTIMMGHGLEWKRTKYSPIQRKLVRFVEGTTAYTNTNLLMVSQEQTDWFAARYGKNCVTVPTATNLPDLNGTDSDILGRYHLTAEGYYLFLGRLVQDKNPDYLIKAFRAMPSLHSQLVIAGDNPSQPDYVAKLKALAEGDSRIVFTGSVYGNDKETLLRHCKVFCIPSTIEGLSISLLEAMSYAKPVIASDIPANREGLDDNGIWVRPENVEDIMEKITYCEDNAGALSELAQDNRRRVEKYFTWQIIGKQYSDYIESLFNK